MGAEPTRLGLGARGLSGGPGGHKPPKGWAKAPLTMILILVVLIAAFFLAYDMVLIF